MFEKLVVIDARAHLMGRLASIVAKQLLSGQKIVVVRAEQINISGSLIRNKLKYMAFLNKRMNTNPRRGPFHHRAPSKMFLRAVRGMISYKSPRGRAALARLKVFEGVPAPTTRRSALLSPRLSAFSVLPRPQLHRSW
eukprot:TRINITY_DN75_c0_g1_i4.p1 TRINITY_DN75_c0_g1~~TRINITY_DN75_c0_g1_i4.p1  ORF type:complete len:138 (+),score=51.96 TRINITY_DN75_c0_g1_i4:74-487(+)